MTIDKEKLIVLLEEKTGLEQKKVEKQLSKLLNRIQQAAQQGKSFEIEGFGTFSMQEGTLHFEPSNRLKTEINNKYAGMKPIELIGAFKKPESEKEVPDMADPDTGIDEKWAFDTEASEMFESSAVDQEDQNLKETEELKDAEGPEEEKEKEVEPDKVFDTTPGTDIGVDENDGGKEAEAFEEESGDDVEEPLESEPESTVEKDPIGRFLVAAVVVISLGVSGWVIYDLGYSDSRTQRNAAVTSQQAESVSPNADHDTGPSAAEEDKPVKSLEPEEESEVTTQKEGPQRNNKGERYGLHGTFNNDNASGYTIVVHSLRDAQKAEQHRQRLEDEGFRALINKARVQGSTFYRVGIGQFETIADAQEAIQEIPEQFRENNFIKRIQ